MKAIFEITIHIAARRRQFAHHDDEIFLCSQNLIGNECVWLTRSERIQGGV